MKNNMGIIAYKNDKSYGVVMNENIPDTKVKVETLIKGFSLEQETDKNQKIIEFLNELRNRGITKVNPFIMNNIWTYYVHNLTD